MQPDKNLNDVEKNHTNEKVNDPLLLADNTDDPQSLVWSESDPQS